MEERFLDINEAAQILAVHPRTIRRWHDDGRFPPACRPGGSIMRWKLSDIHDWIDRDCKSVQFGGWE